MKCIIYMEDAYTGARGFLKGYDVDQRNDNGSVGNVVLTNDRDAAMRFKDMAGAMAAYRTQSNVQPIRPDGHPNCPLTAFHASFETTDE